MKNTVEPFDTMEWCDSLGKAIFVKSNKEDFLKNIFNNVILLLIED